jgi:hypothetical protein
MFLDEYLCKYLKRRGRRLYVSKREAYSGRDKLRRRLRQLFLP